MTKLENGLLTREDEKVKKLIEIQRLINSEYRSISPLFHIFRVLILSHVAVQERSFKELKVITTLSDGNLASHLRALEKSKTIEVFKDFVDRRPRTTYKITSKGKTSLEKMRKIFDEVSYHL